MKWIKNGIKNLALVLLSILAAVLVAEAALWMTGSYSDLATASLKPSNTVWTRPARMRDTVRHPDLDHRVLNVFDAAGVRNHSGKLLQEFTHIIGFFGDSYTENRRLEDRYTVTSLLNEFWGEQRAVNFGIDGFGIEQSFQRWLNFRDIVRMDDVLYVFCVNDLQNLYEIDLFTLTTTDGTVEFTNRYQNNSRPSMKRAFYRYLGKWRVTYLVLEAHYKTRGKLVAANSPALGQMFSDRYLNVARDAYKVRFQDRYGESIELDLMSKSPRSETLAWVEKFRVILMLWKEQVERNGTRFHIAILGGAERELLYRMLGGSIAQYQLVDLTKDSMPAALQGFSRLFKRDGHWNEIGNLAAIPVLADYFVSFGAKAYSPDQKDAFLQAKLAQILEYYHRYGGEPNPAPRLAANPPHN